MILQELHDYYRRKSTDPEAGMAPEGMEIKAIPYIIVIDPAGRFVDLQATGDQIHNRGRSFMVPKSVGRSGKNAWQTAFLFWDHFGYVLGHPKTDTAKDKETARRQNETFIKAINDLPADLVTRSDVQAVLNFYLKNESLKVFDHPAWDACKRISGCNLTFKIAGDRSILPEKEWVVAHEGEKKEDAQSYGNAYRCLITGKKEPIQAKQTATPIPGSKSGAKLVSFQKNSGYDSYGKEQGFNAPISITAENGYTTALKTLLSSETNKYLLAGSTFVFWTQRPTGFENDFSLFFKDPPKDNPDAAVQAIKTLYDSLRTGKFNDQEENRFYLLGLSPNAARISVRFWKTGTVKEFAERIRQHFDDLEIIKGKSDREYLALGQLLRATALEYKTGNIPPRLGGDMVRSIVEGGVYPAVLLNNCMNRVRAERHINRSRAAILKAYLNRQIRVNKKNEKELLMSLDRENKNQAYRLGRLFATLEKIQENAQPGINTTIRDRFYSSASSNPSSVFPLLMRLKNAHLKKLLPGQQVNHEKEVGEIMDKIEPAIPAHLNLNEQATFAVGYYHQRQSFYAKK
ncbi:MAG: type I-C CRISPR-associated protein Cas8c/Csd1 [Pseudomonadota bacterium]